MVVQHNLTWLSSPENNITCKNTHQSFLLECVCLTFDGLMVSTERLRERGKKKTHLWAPSEKTHTFGGPPVDTASHKFFLGGSSSVKAQNFKGPQVKTTSHDSFGSLNWNQNLGVENSTTCVHRKLDPLSLSLRLT